jgi:predicted enzyme related to lactoylglutathione lyase
MVRLYRVILPVSDIEKATSFYSSIFDMSGKRVSSGRHYFDCGGTILACFDPKADGDSFTLPFNPDHVYFAVSNLEETYDRVTNAGCPVDGSIETQPWGERCFYARDPFGNPICFVDQQTLFLG